jgi:hypothetical protein
MSRVLKRPMFKMGGSTGAGITSGLSRRGYHAGGTDRPRITPQEILQGYGPAPRGYNVYDFLTEWGLTMASSPPMGNVIQTAAGTAREPYSKMVEGKDKAGQLEYAMRAQAHDAARTHNLDLKKMDLQEYLGELTAQNQYKKFGVMSPRPEYELKQADVLKDNKNTWDKLFSKNRGKWEGSVYYDSSQHNKGNVINAANSGKIVQNPKNKAEYLVDMTKFEEGDEKNIFWNDSSGEWFSVAYDEEKGTWDIDKEMSMVIGDETEDYTDFSLKEMQNFIENKKEVAEIDITTNIPLPGKEKIIEEIKSVEIIHPTSDGTAKGTISDEYLQEYAEKNKIVFNMADFKKKGGQHSGYRLMTKTQLRNMLRSQNYRQTYASENEKRGAKRTKRKAFIWFNMNLEKFEAGILTKMPKSYEPYVDEYKKLDKKERLKIVRNE